MKKLLILVFLFAAFFGNAQSIIKPSNLVIGGSSSDVMTLATPWVKGYSFGTPGIHIFGGRFEADTVSGTANYTLYIEHSWNYVDWDVLSSVAQTADRDTFLNFQDTTIRPFIRIRNVATSGAQVVKNKVYLTVIN